MLSKIEVHITSANNYWFSVQDCAKLLGINRSSLSRRKNLTTKLFFCALKIKKLFLNEASFKLIFYNNLSILAELDQYKAIGKIETNNDYINILRIGYFYLIASQKLFIEVPNLLPMTKEAFKKNLSRFEVIEGLLIVYLKFRFYQAPETLNNNNVFAYKLADTVCSNLPVKTEFNSLIPEPSFLKILANKNAPLEIISYDYKNLINTLNTKEIKAACCNVLNYNQDTARYNWFDYPIRISNFSNEEIDWL